MTTINRKAAASAKEERYAKQTVAVVALRIDTAIAAPIDGFNRATEYRPRKAGQADRVVIPHAWLWLRHPYHRSVLRYSSKDA